VLDQTYEDIELIVVDDGSTDGTEKVVRSFNNPRIRYIRHEQNRSGRITDSLRMCKRAAQGYLCFTSSKSNLSTCRPIKRANTVDGGCLCYENLDC